MTEPEFEHPGDLLSGLLDGELDPATEEAVRRHLPICPACAAELDEVAAARTLLRRLPQIDLPPAVVGSVHRSFRRRAVLIPGALASAAAVAVVLLVAVPADKRVRPPVDQFVLTSASVASAQPASPQWPYLAPTTLAGRYRRVGAWERDGYVQVLYSDGDRTISVFEQAGRLVTDRLPPRADAVAVNDGQGVRFEWRDEWLVVWQSGPTTYTVVTDRDSDDVMELARSVPPAPRPSAWQRARQETRRVVEELSGSR